MWSIVGFMVFSEKHTNIYASFWPIVFGVLYFAIGMKVIKGKRKALCWVVALFSFQIITYFAKYFIDSRLLHIESKFTDYIYNYFAEILISSLLLWASIWLWRNRTKIVSHHKTGDLTAETAPHP